MTTFNVSRQRRETDKRLGRRAITIQTFSQIQITVVFALFGSVSFGLGILTHCRKRRLDRIVAEHQRELSEPYGSTTARARA